MLIQEMTLFDFTSESDLDNWVVRDDVVMGGRSSGSLSINQAGNGVFNGRVSLENNGGFSSVRYRCSSLDVGNFSKVKIRLRGDGNRFQFRIKSRRRDYHSYIIYFQTNNDWQEIELPFADMYPTFRGRTLDMDNYPGEVIEEIAFLIGNKKAQSFQLEIDKISLE
ncbi:MAG: CIA30 family protein [Bacteroidota bacterium]